MPTASTVAFDIGTLFTTPYDRLRLGASFSNFGAKMQMDGRDIQFSDDPFDEDGNVDIVTGDDDEGKRLAGALARQKLRRGGLPVDDLGPGHPSGSSARRGRRASPRAGRS